MTIEAFIKFLDDKPEVAKKVAACENYNEVAEIAKANGFNFTGLEFTKYAAKLTGELSDAQLEAVAGGNWAGSDEADRGISTSAAVSFGGISISIAIK